MVGFAGGARTGVTLRGRTGGVVTDRRTGRARFGASSRAGGAAAIAVTCSSVAPTWTRAGGQGGSDVGILGDREPFHGVTD